MLATGFFIPFDLSGVLAKSDAIKAATGVAVPASAGAFPPFDSTTFLSQILWLAIVFGAMYFLMARLALPRLAQILEIRRNRIENDLEQARAFEQQSDEVIAAYDLERAEAAEKARELLRAARDNLRAEDEARQRKITADMNAKIAHSEQELAERRKQAMDDVTDMAQDICGLVVSQLLGAKPSGSEVAKAVADATRKAARG